MPSKIINKPKIDFNQKIIVDTLPNPEVVKVHLERIKQIYPKKSEQEITKILNNIVLREIVFGNIMDYISSLYKIEFDDNEINQIKNIDWFKEQVNSIATAKTNIDKEALATELAKQEIRKILLFNELVSLLEISFSEHEFDELIDRYYEDTNLSIREWKKDSKAREGARKTLLNEKLINTLLDKFKNVDPSGYFEKLKEVNTKIVNKEM